MNIKIYHNPRCSKSRKTLEILKERGYEPQIIEYLKTPPSEQDVRRMLKLLDIGPRELMRRGETAYREAGLDREDLSEAALIRALNEHPILLQRPVVIAGDRACIGRPPEAVLDIL